MLAFKDAAEELRRTCSELFALKKRGAPPSEAAELLTRGQLLVQTIKAASREVLLDTKAKNDDVLSVSSAADSDNLQLDNLRYEKSHLLREISKCKTVSTTETAKISLIPIDEFERSAPADLLSVDKETNPHGFHMNRLAHELSLRQKMNEELTAMSVKISAIQEEIAERKKFIDSIPVQLKAIEKATAPLQRHFGQRVSKKMGKFAYSTGLPGPLYVLLCQLEAIEEGREDVFNVSIQAATAPAAVAAPAARSTSKSSKKRAREDADVDMSNDFTEETLTAATKEIVVRLITAGPTAALITTEIIFRYLPLLNIITVESKGKPGLLTSLFPGDYGIESPRLSNYATSGPGPVFPPHLPSRPYHWAQWLGGLYLLPPVPSEAFAAIENRPRLEPSTRKVVETMFSRIAARVSLESQLSALPALQGPHPDALQCFPGPTESTRFPSADVLSWRQLTPEEALSVRAVFLPPGGIPGAAVTRTVRQGTGTPSIIAPLFTRAGLQDFDVDVAGVLAVEAGIALLDMLGEEGEEGGVDAAAPSSVAHTKQGKHTPAPLVAGEEYYHEARYFRAVLGFGGAFLQALVEVCADYPVRPPRFRLCPLSAASTELTIDSRKPIAIENLERELNVFAPVELSPTPACEPLLLSHTLRALTITFPLILSSSSSSTSSAATGGRIRRGRDRGLPLKFDPAARTMLHR